MRAKQVGHPHENSVTCLRIVMTDASYVMSRKESQRAYLRTSSGASSGMYQATYLLCHERG